MSFSTLDVNITRQRLLVILGDDSKKYFSTLRAWFSLKLTKEDFDREAKKLIPPNLVHLHNDFLLAILGKCQSLCRQAVPRPSNLFTTQDIKPQIDQTDVEIKPRIIHQTPVKMEIDPEPVQIIPIVKERPVKPKVKLNRHQPLDPIDVLKAIKFPVNKVSARNNPVLSYCHRDLMLPDTAMIHGRMMVIAWEYGLDGVSDNAVELLILAVQNQLRSLLTTIITRRRSYKLRDGFQHAIGQPVPNTWIHNTWLLLGSNGERNVAEVTDANDPFNHVPSLCPTLAEVEREAALNEACSVNDPKSLPPVSLLELFEALQGNKQAIPSHSIYSVNMERIASKMWHSSDLSTHC